MNIWYKQIFVIQPVEYLFILLKDVFHNYHWTVKTYSDTPYELAYYKHVWQRLGCPFRPATRSSVNLQHLYLVLSAVMANIKEMHSNEIVSSDVCLVDAITFVPYMVQHGYAI